MPSAQHAQFVIVRRLHANRQAIHARIFEHAQKLIGHRVWIAFYRDLGIRQDGKPLAQTVQHARQALSSQKRRRTAAEIDGISLPSGKLRRKLVRMPKQCLDIVIHLALLSCEGIKIAVTALGRAERDVNIKSELTLHPA